MKIITLLTDFGTRDWFVASMKGVITGIAPRARVVDITHEIAAGDIWSAAFVLAQAAPTFPRGTIHVAVVDPTVGSERKALLARISGQYFLAPDNGLLSLVAKQGDIEEIREVTNTRYFRNPVCNIFHGRDIFAPVAAHLARGVAPKNFGPKLNRVVRLDIPPASSDEATVLYIDRFGNCITNYKLGSHPPAGITFRVSRTRISGIKRSYAAVRQGSPLATVGSTGLVEIAVNGGNAAKRFGLKIGSKIYVKTSH